MIEIISRHAIVTFCQKLTRVGVSKFEHMSTELERRYAFKALLHHNGISSITASAFENLYQLFQQHLIVSAKSLMNFAELNNRTRPTWKDALPALEHITSIKELRDFCTGEIQLELERDESGSTNKFHSVQYPEQTGDFVQSALIATEDPEEYRLKRAAIPDHFPEFPPRHSYLSTKVIYSLN
jgi:hypothetical protein